MFYHVITHTECNLACKYCVRDEFGEVDDKYDYSLPCKISYDISKLKEFVGVDDYVTFYGGEPLLAMEDVKRIMDEVACKGYMVQTNGLLLKELGGYAKLFHTILVSIDGCEECTDRNRGSGVHAKVMSNVAWLNERFDGELIARMTITEGSNLYKQVLWLNEKFSAIHWQLDAMFFEQKNEGFDSYNADVTKLVDYWVDSMKRGKVLRWYPFMVLMHDMLKGIKSKLRCGSGYANYTVNTKGTVVACPIMCGMKDYHCGSLDSEKL
jgi:putative peptide-modifying radical SAM enzyme